MVWILNYSAGHKYLTITFMSREYSTSNLGKKLTACAIGYYFSEFFEKIFFNSFHRTLFISFMKPFLTSA